MTHQPDHARGHEPFEKLGARRVIVERAVGLPHDVQERRRPEGSVRGGTAG